MQLEGCRLECSFKVFFFLRKRLLSKKYEINWTSIDGYFICCTKTFCFLAQRCTFTFCKMSKKKGSCVFTWNPIFLFMIHSSGEANEIRSERRKFGREEATSKTLRSCVLFEMGSAFKEIKCTFFMQCCSVWVVKLDVYWNMNYSEVQVPFGFTGFWWRVVVLVHHCPRGPVHLCKRG